MKNVGKMNGVSNFYGIIRVFIASLVLLLVLDDVYAASSSVPGGALGKSGGNSADSGEVITSKVICNVVRFVRNIGLPIMTGVIVGSSIMAIFGRLAWPAIAALVVFTAVFFGAEKVISKFAEGVSGVAAYECQ